jgi:acyl carrier protein
VVFSSEPGKVLDLLRDLREWFGKPVILDEDRLRAQSLRQAAAMGTLLGEPTSRETFLNALEARISFQLSRDAQDQRAFELVNKTNQFNLNGRRITETGWRQTLENPEGFLLTASYADKFGPLGKIAVVLGESRSGAAAISSWVMSCRAFSRRVEHATFSHLFESMNLDKVLFHFEKTERNTPLQEFFASLGIRTRRRRSRAPSSRRAALLSPTLWRLMQRSDLEGKLSGIFGVAFEGLKSDSTRLATRDTVGNWDSIAMMNLVALIEEEFGQTFDLEEAAEWTSYEQVRAALSKRLEG